MESVDLGGDAFSELQAGLTVSLISTPRKRLSTCSLGEPEIQARQRAAESGNFDYLPVMDCSSGERRIVGLFCSKRPRSEYSDDSVVGDDVIGLSDANLIGADASIWDFILGVCLRPICLTVSGQQIDGLVSWADLQKLPVRVALFGMITGFELSMSGAIKRRFDEGDGWMQELSPSRQLNIRERIERSLDSDSEVDALLHTQFADKATIVRKSLSLGESNSAANKALNRIENLRNLVAHANNYAGSLAEAKRLALTVRQLLELQGQLKDFQAHAPH